MKIFLDIEKNCNSIAWLQITDEGQIVDSFIISDISKQNSDNRLQHLYKLLYESRLVVTFDECETITSLQRIYAQHGMIFTKPFHRTADLRDVAVQLLHMECPTIFELYNMLTHSLNQHICNNIVWRINLLYLCYQKLESRYLGNAI